MLPLSADFFNHFRDNSLLIAQPSPFVYNNPRVPRIKSHEHPQIHSLHRKLYLFLDVDIPIESEWPFSAALTCQEKAYLKNILQV